MPKYFETFPKRLYDIANTGNPKLVTDIFRRLKVKDGIKDNLALYATYDVVPGDTPESISYKHFGSTDYFWVICLMNDITDRVVLECLNVIYFTYYFLTFRVQIKKL